MGREGPNKFLCCTGDPDKYLVLVNCKLQLLIIFGGEIFASSLDSNQKYKRYFRALERNVLKI